MLESQSSNINKKPGKSAFITGDWVNLREGPYLTAKVVHLAKKNEEVRVLRGLTSGWVEVECNNGRGFVFASYLNISLEGFRALEIDSDTAVFDGPGRNSKKLRSMKRTEKLLAFQDGVNQKWIRVLLPDSNVGYVLRERVHFLYENANQPMRKSPLSGVFIDSQGNVREEPTTTGRIIDVPSVGTRFTVIEQREKWFKVQYQSKVGWTNQINIKLN